MCVTHKRKRELGREAGRKGTQRESTHRSASLSPILGQVHGKAQGLSPLHLDCSGQVQWDAPVGACPGPGLGPASVDRRGKASPRIGENSLAVLLLLLAQSGITYHAFCRRPRTSCSFSTLELRLWRYVGSHGGAHSQ